MNFQEYVGQKMQQYSEAFDFYMDTGRMPDDMPADDWLCGYMQSVLEDNPQSDSQDLLWHELLKYELMNFIHTLLLLYIPAEQEYRRQYLLLDKFAKSDLNGKRRMWSEVCQTLTDCYTEYEVNVRGYLEQMGQMNEEQKEIALSSLCHDWEKANCDRKERMEKMLFETNKDKWEESVRKHGLCDYRRLKNIEEVYERYPLLRKIVGVLGREKPHNQEEWDRNDLKLRWLTFSNHVRYDEVEELSVGRELEHMVPSELMFLSDESIETVFYYKYAVGELQLLANLSRMKACQKTERRKPPEPRLQMGPFVVGVDTSGSMSGWPERVAKGLLLQLLGMAKRQRRKCYLIAFSVRAEAIDLACPANWNKLKDFLCAGFSGGTDGEQMLRLALDVLQSDKYAMADVLVISDFHFSLPVQNTCSRIKKEQNCGVRFYGLQIGKQPCSYENILDYIWQI